jgi:hypothetical protein
VRVEQVADSLERPDGTARADGRTELASQPAGPDPKVVELAPRLRPHNAPKQGRTPGRRQRCEAATVDEQIEEVRLGTHEEVSKEFNVTRERIRQIEAEALRKLRHPSRSRKLRDYLVE